jgi:hypothetical protein
MTTMLIVVAVLLVLTVLVVRSKRWRSSIRMVEGDWGFVRLYPNPGVKFGERHWCRHYGRKAH